MLKTTRIIMFLALTSFFSSSYTMQSVYAQDEEVIDFEEAELDDAGTDASSEEELSDEELDEEFAEDEAKPAAAPEAEVTEKEVTENPPDAAGEEVLEPLSEDPPQLSEDLPQEEVDQNATVTAPVIEPPAEELNVDSSTSGSEFTSLEAGADDGPDLEYEARLYDIYVRHQSRGTTPEEWDRVVGTRSDQRYRIQRGDTLWDISQTLFGDGNYWPKIWSLNSSITNPHLIRPNNVIRFILGDESGPPAFTVTEAEQEDSSNTTMTTITQNDDGPEIPPPTKRYNPVVKKLPPSLPAYQDPYSAGDGYDDAGIEYGRRKIADLVDQIPLAAYIDEAKPKPLGRVTEVETGFNLASSLQYIYVRMNKGEGEVGMTYLAVMDRGNIKADSSIVREKNLGVGIEVLGEVQLLEKVMGEKGKETDGDIYRALVTKTVSPVAVGSALITDKIEQVNLSEKGPRSQVVAQIIGGQFTNERKLYGPQSFAFLNKGQNDGLEVGQILPIRLNRKARDQSSQVLANVRAIGWLKIVKTTPKFSTAVILRSWEGIATGDFTGAGEMSLSQAGLENLEDQSGTSATKGSLLEELDEDEDSVTE
jgi:hypothetical protein